jgi:transcriptional regulator CtsR
VLTTRFTVDRGYYIESKRGGGGCIIIRHVEFDEHKSLWDIINDRIGNSITYDGGMQIIDGLLSSDIITERESNIMKACINDRLYANFSDNKNKARAEILKSMIMAILI